MSNKPIFVATHPRACSTAFERVFMTRRKTLKCVHEPFGDAYYFGPERLGLRYEKDAQSCQDSGFAESSYRAIFERIERENTEGKRLFIKDMSLYMLPPDQKPATIAPSLVSYKHGVGTFGSPPPTPINDGPPYPYNTQAEPGNPTVVPKDLLSVFHFIFLIRHPRNSIPSYYRCTIPPLDDVTKFYNFMPCEVGYYEIRRMFDYLREIGQVGPKVATHESNGTNGTAGSQGVEICVVDADDLLDNPSGIIKEVCRTTGIPFEPEMLTWKDEEDHRIAKEAFEKWKGFHDDAINSTELKPRAHKKIPKPDDVLYAEWVEKYGQEGADVIKQTVADTVADYEYLKQFAIKVE